jgi:hypothetical protein
MVTFIEKLLIPPQAWRKLVPLSLVCFIVSIVASMSVLLQSSIWLGAVVTQRPDANYLHVFKTVSTVIGFLAFFIGVNSLIAFAMKNLP